MQKLRALFERYSFEEISAPFAIPDLTENDPQAARYDIVGEVDGSGQRLFLRSYGTGFNLLPRPARSQLVRVYCTGPGLYGEREVPDLGLAQWHRPDLGAADSLLRELTLLVSHLRYEYKAGPRHIILYAAFLVKVES